MSAWGKDSFLPMSFEAKFTQIHKNAISGKEKKSDGSLQYKYPGRIRFEVENPDKVLFISNLERSWYYTPPIFDGEPGDVTISKSTDNPLLNFLDSLKDGIKDGKLFKAQPVGKNFNLIFKEEPSKKIGLKEAFLSFNNGNEFKDLVQIDLTYLEGKKVSFKLNNVNVKPVFKDEHFIFVIPKNTRIAK